MTYYLGETPKTLQEDFVDNRVIPFVGAGFSKNAVLPNGISMPDWNELGRQIAEYITEYDYSNAIDALSLFESHFSRVKLIEILAKKLHINELKPGETHRSFCNLFFDTICTTNFDFLLEHTLQETKRPHSIIASEDRLPIDANEKTKVIKLHGDFNHPERMVITENDYDIYLERNKILATYISNLFITKTLFLVGYSFEDNDMRGLWQIINSRLGHLHRPAYAVMVDASSIEVSRFERRNIKVINLKGKKEDYQQILNQFFIEIKTMIDEKAPSKITPTNEKAREELKLPSRNKRLCFISAPYSRISILKELIYPILIENEITPITLDEAIMPGDNWMAKSETLLKESSFAIVDASGNNANVLWELDTILNLKKKLIVIVDEDQTQAIPFALSNQSYLTYSTSNDNQNFIIQMNEMLSSWLELPDLDSEPDRLLRKYEYDAAVIAAYRQLEISLREYSSIFTYGSTKTMPVPLSHMLRRLRDSNLPTPYVDKAIDYLRIRNQIVHETTMGTNKKIASDIVKTLNNLIGYIKQEGVVLK